MNLQSLNPTDLLTIRMVDRAAYLFGFASADAIQVFACILSKARALGQSTFTVSFASIASDAGIGHDRLTGIIQRFAEKGWLRIAAITAPPVSDSANEDIQHTSQEAFQNVQEAQTPENLDSPGNCQKPDNDKRENPGSDLAGCAFPETVFVWAEERLHTTGFPGIATSKHRNNNQVSQCHSRLYKACAPHAPPFLLTDSSRKNPQPHADVHCRYQQVFAGAV